MASKANTRFIVLLVAAFVAVLAGVAGLIWVVKMKSGARYVARGDAKMALGDVDDAERLYSIAVNKEQQNVEWLRKWQGALLRKVPKTQDRYFEDFRWLVLTYRQLAIAQKTNVAAHREYLDVMLRQAELGGGARGLWDMVANEADRALRYFSESDPPGWRVLGRFRGIARINALSGGAALDDTRIEEARADLETALSIDPGDGESAAALAAYHRRAADEERRLDHRDAERRALDAATGVLETAVSANPNSAAAWTVRLRLKLDLALRGLDTTRPPAEVFAARRARLDSVRPLLDETIAALRRLDPSVIDQNRAFDLYAAAALVDRELADSSAAELIDRVLAVRPEAVDLVYLQGRLHMARGEFEPAITRMQSIVDQPTPPLSFDGVRLFEYRKMARFTQANAALSLASAAPAGPERGAANQRADHFRGELIKLVPEKGTAEVVFIDAKRALIREDYRGAEKLLDEYSALTADAGFDAFEALSLGGHVAVRLAKDGKARDLFTRALESRPDSVGVRLALADVEARLQLYEDALRSYRLVLDLDPTNAAALERSTLIQGMTTGVKVDDPVMQVLIDADRLQRGAPGSPKDPDAAMRLIEGTLERLNWDPKLVVWIVSTRVLGGDVAGARDALARGLAVHPNDETLGAFDRQLRGGASLEAGLALLDQSEAPAADKLIGRYQLYLQYGKAGEADAALRELAEKHADDPRVIELRFMDALARKDLPAAQRLVETARAQDIDRVGGLTFHARMQIARDDLRGAAETLRQASSQANVTVGTLRLRAQVLMQLGRGGEAIDALRDGVRLNPADRDTLKALIVALANNRQTAEALRVARESEAYARLDPQYLNILYELEAAVGDRAAAITGREKLKARSPDDAGNATALVSLYIDATEFSKARTLLDELRAKDDSIQLAGLDARWHADQGDLDGAQAVFLAFLDKLMREQKVPMTSEPWLAFGEFLIQHGRVDVGLAAMEKGAVYQSEKQEADLYRADRLVSLGRFPDAETVYRKVVDAKAPDPDRSIASRLIETLIQQDKFDAAAAEVAKIGPDADSTMSLLVLRAAIADRKGDTRAARVLLDRAIERFGQDAVPYYRRALLTARNLAFVDDAVADLDQSLRLRPDFWQARIARANMNFLRDRTDEALDDLRAGVASNPMLDEASFSLIAELIRAGLVPEAVDTAREGLKLRPNDARYSGQAAEIFDREDLWEPAAEFYGHVWNVRKDDVAAASYLRTLLRCDPPKLAEAEGVLGAPGIHVERQPGLMMMRTKLRVKQGQTARAETDAVRAYTLAAGDARVLMPWYEGFIDAFPDPSTQFRLLNQCSPNDATRQWHAFMVAAAQAGIPAERPAARDALSAQIDAVSDPLLATYVSRMLQDIHASAGDYEAALEAAKKGLAKVETDWVLNNNAAAFLNEHLSRPAEALPFAKKAYENNPNSVGVLDTLAGVYLGQKDWKSAEETLIRGLRLAKRPTDKAKFLLWLVRSRVEAGDRPGAQRWTAQLRRLLVDAGTALTDEQKSELDDLERRAR
ncbi:MAG: tetratricopeptide repeat protein [Phycisphaerales bacterium]